MSTKTFKKVDIKNAVRQDTDETSTLVLQEAGKWIDDGKYQSQENILKETATGKFWQYWHGKSGSYFTEYTYSWESEDDDIELVEVESIIIETEIWAAVENK